jgi:hypothetical protein
LEKTTMVSSFEDVVGRGLLAAFGDAAVSSQVALQVRNLPQEGEELFEFAKKTYERWVGLRYPSSNSSRHRQIDYMVETSDRTFLVEVEGKQHIHNGYRSDSFRYYPSGTMLYYDVKGLLRRLGSKRRIQGGESTGWVKSKHFRHRDQERAFRDLLADVFCGSIGVPLVRVFEWGIAHGAPETRVAAYVMHCIERPIDSGELIRDQL